MSQAVRHALTNDSAHVALVEISILTKLHIEASNRSFAQMARRIRERLERVVVPDEMMGDL